MEKPKKGDLLISEPFLPDPNFERSVILLCEHNEEGSLGFMLNKPSGLKLEDVLDEVHDFDKTLYSGGPVQEDTLHFIHRVEDVLPGGDVVKDGIYWGGNFEQLMTAINTRQIYEGDIRFFVGYSGWAPGQLENELKENSWIIYRHTDAYDVFETAPELLWRELLKKMGGKYRMYSNYPIDPRLN